MRSSASLSERSEKFPGVLKISRSEGTRPMDDFTPVSPKSLKKKRVLLTWLVMAHL